MAINTETTVTFTDDLDGESGATVATREIKLHVLTELSDDNYAYLMSELGRLLPKARQVPPPPVAAATKSKGKSASPAVTARNKRIRAWAEKNGIDVSGRGRPGKDVEAAYVDATGDVG